MKRFIFSIILVVALAAPSLPQVPSGQLASVIQNGKRAAALEMIRAGVDVNEAQPDGTRPIHWAVYRVDYDLVGALIAKKAKVDAANEFGYTPLAEAVKQGDARMVKLLLDGGSGAEGANLDGQTALMMAISTGDLAIFQMLIDAGAKVNVVEKAQDQTPLMWAAAATRNAAEMVKVLIAKGANVKARAKFNDWPSQITSEPRAQYHTYGGLTPLLYAARNGCYACVEALVSAGADVNVPNPEGMTPTMMALDNSQNGIAKFFLDHGANPHVWDVYGRTALYVAVDHAGGGGGGAGAAPAGGGRGGAGGAAPAGGGRGGLGGAPAGGQGGPGAGAAPAGGGRGGPGAGAPAGGGRGGAGAAPVAPGAGAAPAAGTGGLAAAPAAAPAQARGGGGQGGRGGGAGGAGGGGGAGGQRGGGQAGPGGGGRGGGAAAAGPQVSSLEIINFLLAAGVNPNSELNQRRPEAGSGGRFNDPLLSSGTTPLLLALVGNNIDVARLLLEKGANPNIFGMGVSPWLYATGLTSGVTGGRGGGGGTVNTELLDLMLKHGADVNAQVTGAATYSGRVSYAQRDPVTVKSNEGMTAMHVAVRSQNAGLVKYLLDHGARADILDASGRTPLDVLNGVPALPPAVGAEAEGLILNYTPPTATAAGGRGGAAPRGGGGAAAGSEEIRTMLQNAPKTPQK